MSAATSHDKLPHAQGLYDPAYEHDACGLGFVAHLHGERSAEIVRTALELLANMAHRGASAGATSDGAGILLQLPHAFLRAACHAEHLPLPDAGDYGVGMMFLPATEAARAAAMHRVDAIVASHGCRVLGWRAVPVNPGVLAGAAYDTLPAIQQVLVAPSTIERLADDPSAFERTLYVIRRAIERASLAESLGVYLSSMSSRTIVYKGLLNPDQIAAFYVDLQAPDFQTGIALVHSRFSTNTFPSWANAHPFRLLCHNGEINTLRGNVNWMRVREPELASPRFPDGFDALKPIVQSTQSDSACLDNAVELLLHAGRPLSHAMAMLVPEAWQADPSIADDRRSFYAYHASLVEPWDGPAAIAFTDGRQVGAIQDRNGLRPARWMLTDDDLVILASEAGVVPIEASRVREKGRLQPGKILLVNTTQGRLLHDDEVKEELATLRPYRRWVTEQRIDLETLIDDSSPGDVEVADDTQLRTAHRLFGYTRDELAMVLEPMAHAGEEPTGSMGSDTPLAVLSDQPQLLYSYFRQLFAQVTNPPIDPIREQLVMSLHTWLGAQRNLLDETPEHARQIEVAHPVLSDAAMRALRAIDDEDFRSITLSTSFAANDRANLAATLDALCADAAAAVTRGYRIVILSDRDAASSVDHAVAPIPSLLATAAVHHHLLRRGLRARASLVVETGDAREVSHVALLFSYGAAAVHPYLALESCARLAARGAGEASAHKAAAKARRSYIKSVEKGLLKILSKLGISTLQSYCGAQNWEAIGIGRDVIDRHFTGTPSKLGGLDLAAIADDILRRHQSAVAEQANELLDDRGEYHFRARGEHHGWNPTTIATLQRAAREGSWSSYEEFARASDEDQRVPTTLRGMLDFVETDSIPLDDVEAAASIVRRFVTGAMSFGSISREAHETLALAMNQIGGRSNTGEGGEDPARFGTPRNSAIKQVASGRFGVTAAYLTSARELQIKMAQGAKPGEGGQLPGHKVDETIARTRHATAGVSLISPPPHHDIYSIEDLKQLIFDLWQVHPDADVSVKLVSEAGVGTVAAGVAKAGADLITISGDGGGTGAAPLSSIKRAGVPWEMGLAEAQQTLLLNGLRGQVRLQADGQLKTGRDVVIAALLGADEFGFATAPLVVQGCVMMRKCHLNTCPVGIATQDPVLREKFAGKPEHLINYLYFVAEETRRLLALLGARSIAEIVGRTELLRQRADVAHSKAATLDLAPLLHGGSIGGQRSASGEAADASTRVAPLNRRLVELATPALVRGERVVERFEIHNTDRAVGTAVAGEIARRFGESGLPPETIALHFRGSAGQSFGAFATRGLSLELEGEANDYLGKGLCGARLVVLPPKCERLLADGTVIVGNTVLYGATSGEAFIAGAAGERFAVRNSGATAVVEGVGDHGCEYMTGGVVVVLGSIGRNFAAGMSGGVAYVQQQEPLAAHIFESLRFEVVPLAESGDVAKVRALIELHARLTGSRRAKRALAHWSDTVRAFARVLPLEYKAAVARTAAAAATEEAARYG